MVWSFDPRSVQFCGAGSNLGFDIIIFFNLEMELQKFPSKDYFFAKCFEILYVIRNSTANNFTNTQNLPHSLVTWSNVPNFRIG